MATSLTLKTQGQVDQRIPRYINLVTCDTNCLWLNVTSGFRRIFVDEDYNTTGGTLVPFNDDACNKSHLCYFVHGREASPFHTTCRQGDSVTIQRPESGHANIFNSIYWKKCDGTFRNALDETLMNSGIARNHNSMTVRLRDIIAPYPEGAPEYRREDYEKDMRKYEKYSNCYVRRFM